jgi:hypothetical protein
MSPYTPTTADQLGICVWNTISISDADVVSLLRDVHAAAIVSSYRVGFIAHFGMENSTQDATDTVRAVIELSFYNRKKN